jgi:hypothetical protein
VTLARDSDLRARCGARGVCLAICHVCFLPFNAWVRSIFCRCRSRASRCFDQ